MNESLLISGEGRLRRLKPEVERTLNGEVHVPMGPGEESPSEAPISETKPLQLAS